MATKTDKRVDDIVAKTTNGGLREFVTPLALWNRVTSLREMSCKGWMDVGGTISAARSNFRSRKIVLLFLLLTTISIMFTPNHICHPFQTGFFRFLILVIFVFDSSVLGTTATKNWLLSRMLRGRSILRVVVAGDCRSGRRARQLIESPAFEN